MRFARLLRSSRLACGALAVLLLAGCASGPRRGSEGPGQAATAREFPADRDGPGQDVPADLAKLADAEPRIEPVRPGGANKPYQVLGRDYVPFTRDTAFRERGLASWYGRKFHGRRTASGEVYDMYAMTAAHPTLPIPSYARIRNPANGREIVVRINDRGPFHAQRIVDLSYAAAFKLDLLRGVAPVELERVTFDDIRAGTWRRDGALVATAPAVTLPPLDFVALAPADVPSEALAEASTQASTQASTETSVLPPASPSPPARAERGFWVQLGAFRERAGADGFLRRVASDIEAFAPLLSTFADATLFRVQAGPYPSRGQAQGAAQRLREALGLVPVIVERR